jgi:hypothetical protein
MQIFKHHPKGRCSSIAITGRYQTTYTSDNRLVSTPTFFHGKRTRCAKLLWRGTRNLLSPNHIRQTRKTIFSTHRKSGYP